MTTYAQCEEALSGIEADIDMAECHGVMCGLLCACAPFADQQWLAEAIGEDAKAAHAQHCCNVLMAVREETVARLDGGGMEFSPMLPDEGESMRVRTRALADWCTGFLYGLGVGGVKSFERLPANTQEILNDFLALTRISDETDESEAEETDYMELVEYVRVGVMLVREELRGHASSTPPRSIH